MTDPAPLTATVSPPFLYTSAPDQYQGALLTLTITAPPSASYDLSGGLRIVLPVDPGGAGSQAALVLSTASGTAGGTGQPTAAVEVDASVLSDGWSIVEDFPGTCSYQALPNGSGVLPAGDSLQFAFADVVADQVAGSANVTVTVPPAGGTGAPLSLTAPVIKLPAPLTARLSAASYALSMPDNTTQLSWQVLGAVSCDLTWTQDSTKVLYNGTSHDTSPWSGAPFQFTGDELPVAILLAPEETFTLTASGAGGDNAPPDAKQISVAPPTLTALTIPPLVTGVSPASGAPEGGQPVTITGTGLSGTPATVAVAFGTATATAVTANPDGSVTATAPPGPGGSTVPVTVTTLTGVSPAAPAAAYTYVAAPAPAVTGIAPPGGSADGGQPVTISGSGLAGATTVTFGSVAATAFTANPDGSLTVTVPPLTLSPGTLTAPLPVTVATPAGSSPPAPAAQYTYAAAGIPVVFAVQQDGAGDYRGGQNPVTISGVNFGQATAVAFGAASITDFTVDPTGTSITATAPHVDSADATDAPSTTVDVTVTVGGNTTVPVTSALNSADRYTYANSLQSVAPYQPFRLTWSCYNDPVNSTSPVLSWSLSNPEPSSVTDSVTVTAAASGTVSNPGNVKVADSAVVTVTAPTTFQIDVPDVPVPAPFPVPVGQVGLSAPVATVPVADPVDGTQSVTLTWTAQNATGFTLAGGGLNEPSLPYDQRSYQVTALSLAGLSTFTLTANGFDDAGGYAPVSESVTVEPLPVQLTVASASAQAHVTDAATGRQSATVGWTAANAVLIIVTGGAQLIVPGIHDTLASVALPFPPPSTGPVSYPVTITAYGYVKPGVSRTGTVTVLPTALQLLSFTTSDGKQDVTILRGEPVRLVWDAVAPTGFTLSTDVLLPNGEDTEDIPLGAGIGTVLESGIENTTAYRLTAQGYLATPLPPSRTVVVAINKGQFKELSGARIEKNPVHGDIQPFAEPAAEPASGIVPGPGDLADQSPAAGSGPQQAFIGRDDRPGMEAPGTAEPPGQQ